MVRRNTTVDYRYLGIILCALFTMTDNSLENFMSALCIIIFQIASIYLMPVAAFLSIYLLFLTSYWWLVLLYCGWAYIIDVKTPEHGARLLPCIKNCKFTFYVRDYFPIGIIKSEEHELNPNKNYLFVAFPHGAFSTGSVIAFGSAFPCAEQIYPRHKTHTIALSTIFLFPISRELALFFGYCSSSKSSITYLLSKPGGGNIVCLLVGGVREMVYCYPNNYTFVLKNRKGFVKIALKTGSPLVPVISFGENDIYYGQLYHPVLFFLQKIMKLLTSIFFIFVIGRYYLPFFPRKRPISLVGTNLKNQ